MEMHGDVRWIESEAHDALDAEARGGNNYEARGGSVDD